MATHIAFLRGINVGRSKRIAMADLRSLAADLGYADARTHLASGNLVLTTTAGEADIVSALQDGIADRFQMDVLVVVRSRKELARAVADNPFADVATDPARHLVTFLAQAPRDDDVALLLDSDFGDEQLGVVGREVHCWLPSGLQNATLTHSYLERALGVVATGRNWNTVTNVLELLGR